MNKSILHNINLYTLYALAFAIPHYKKIIPVLIILFLVISLINGNYSIKLKSKKILLFTSLYFAYAIGLFYTNNLNAGRFDLEIKLSFVLFPIAFFISKLNIKESINSVLKWFLLGCLSVSIFNIVEAFYQFFLTHEETELFYAKLSEFHHASYYSMYLSLALIITYYFSFKPNKSIFFSPKKAMITIGFFSILIGLLSSKSGIITMLIIHSVAIGYWTIKHRNYTKSILTVLLISIGLGLAYQFSYSFNARINEAISVITSKETSKKSTTGVRIHAWNTSLSLIKKQPLIGYGTGDVKDVLVEEYIKLELPILADKKLNPHNQYLQTSLALGLIGGLILIGSLILPLYFSFLKKHYLYAFFILLFAFNILTESMLETQSGIVFYAFFNALFFSAYFSKNKTNSVSI